MSAEQYQRNINSLDKDIASLEKKKAEADKKCAELQKKINSTQKSISSRTSASMTASKMKQIAVWQSDYAKKCRRVQILERKFLKNEPNEMMHIQDYKKNNTQNQKSKTKL